MVGVRDEIKGENVGTSGAVLTAGEELRPTGTDRGLLARISNMTGGTLRDNLAGSFQLLAGCRVPVHPRAQSRLRSCCPALRWPS